MDTNLGTKGTKARDRGFKISRVLWILGLLLTPLTYASAAPTGYYVYDLLMSGTEHRQIIMKVEPSPQKIVITYYNEFKDAEICTFSPSLKPLGVAYCYPDKTQTRVTYDYVTKKIVVQGENQATYSLQPNTFDNSGSLFYLFPRMPLSLTEPYLFRMTQNNVRHIEDPLLRFLVAQLIGPVEMYVQYKNTQVLESMGSTCTAAHYAMGIHDGRLARFWPNVYDFWLRESDRTLIRYQGMNAFKKTDILTLVNYYEK